VLANAYAESTLSTYNTGLLIYHVFCDRKGIAEEHRAPADKKLMASFIATIAGVYAGSSIANYVHGIHAWHTIHGVAWYMNKDELDHLLKSASGLAPPSSKKAKREPVLITHIEKIKQQLDLSKPLDAAVYACLTTAFWTTARIGEFTVPKLDAFQPQLHIKRSDVNVVTDQNSLRQTEFFLPRTKSAPTGESVSWAEQLGPADPKAALENHLSINQMPDSFPLFAHRHPTRGPRPLTKHAFLARVKAAALAAGISSFQGHGIRIGSTLEYLLRGVPFDVIKVKGRWASDTFTLYLRKHGQILAPYMQATPVLQDTFVRYTMPAAR